MGDIRQRDIRAFQVKYHRNGISGEGFYFCKFLLRNGNEFRELGAVVFEAPGRIAVISGDIAERFRGDDFERTIREAITLSEENQRSEVYS